MYRTVFDYIWPSANCFAFKLIDIFTKNKYTKVESTTLKSILTSIYYHIVFITLIFLQT